MKTLYCIRDWDSIYENHESRKRKHLEWIPVKNKHDGLGFRRMVKQKNRCELFSAFILLVQLASKTPVRGQLSEDSAGNLPLSADDAADKTGFPADIFEKAFSFFSGPENSKSWIIAKNGQSADIPADRADVSAASAASPGLNRIEGKGIEENRREEKATPIFPENLTGDEFLKAWGKWIIHRQEIKKKLTPSQIEEQLKWLSGIGVDRAIKCILFTVKMGWQGLREEEVKNTSGSRFGPLPQFTPEALIKQAEALKNHVEGMENGH
jgi:hypothetical protein